MVEVKNCCKRCPLRNDKTVLTAMLLVYSMTFYEVTSMTTHERALVIFVETGFTCKNGTRIRGHQRCDGKGDCYQNEDEVGCIERDCLEDSDCSKYLACFENKCKNPCTICSSNIPNERFNGRTSFTLNFREEPKNVLCIRKNCKDPCVRCASSYAICEVENHKPKCISVLH
ncbi:low-density lipoprotein receptor-related protein 2-like [Planococcus citri]|uniref:low-density lipoprotein receptor-related protein 2-like n=1 Tax=Planococcus citri TaxID=170843 RepID=UPI0031F73599